MDEMKGEERKEHRSKEAQLSNDDESYIDSTGEETKPKTGWSKVIVSTTNYDNDDDNLRVSFIPFPHDNEEMNTIKRSDHIELKLQF
ncbi:hypothetical protein BPAE_0061g00410 [Botrytis paeoniae]|uniref:Uncharacterized protein n=1 Tax=Botrytis paeoniae TaxID=278948 RepID=A0A4Z1FTY5_9HELO|nr:hypothetical protein BPAE_0061g00410 [Botrytis paeoniae]